MNPSSAYGAGSLLAYVLAAIGSGSALGPNTCVPVGAVVLLAIASPRDIWEIARSRLGARE